MVGWFCCFGPSPKEGAGLVVPFLNGASPSLVQHEILPRLRRAADPPEGGVIPQTTDQAKVNGDHSASGRKGGNAGRTGGLKINSTFLFSALVNFPGVNRLDCQAPMGAGRKVWEWSFRYPPSHRRCLQGNPACCLNSCAPCTAPRACPEGGPAGCLKLAAIQTPCACQSIRAVPPEHLRTRRIPGVLIPEVIVRVVLLVIRQCGWSARNRR